MMDSSADRNSSNTIDISFLLEDRSVEFFNDAGSCFDAEWPNPGTNLHVYPQIMGDFKEAVSKAMYVVNKELGISLKDKPIWARMREKYFGGRGYIYPDEMILHVGEFSEGEAVAYLWYCTCYKERFCDGAYGDYAKAGLIGQVLQRLKGLHADS